MAHPDRQTHFYASSGGNAGLACVVAARSLGHEATVVVPYTTKPMMIAKIKAAGASDVIQHGNDVGQADTYLRTVVMPSHKDGVYVPPFDHHVRLIPKSPSQSSKNQRTISISGKATPP